MRAVSRDYYDALVLVERATPADPEEVERLLVDAYLSKPLSDADEQLLRRARFAGLDVDVRVLSERAARGVRMLRDLAIERGLSR